MSAGPPNDHHLRTRHKVTYGEKLGQSILAQSIRAGTSPVLRFAPSPNGELHLGHALSALINLDAARASGGRLLLRIEDIDLGRRRDIFVDGILRDIEWLGISWPQPVLHQSTRFDAYRLAAEKLDAMGLLYPCFATRAEIAAAAEPGSHDPDGAPLYRRSHNGPAAHNRLAAAEIARRKAAGEAFAMRIDMPRAMATARQMPGGETLSFREIDAEGNATVVGADPARWGDAVILRKDVPVSYHLAVVLDDAFQGVSHVIRGEDLKAATDIHVLLQVLLGLPALSYHHHRLMSDETGRKLAKSSKDQSLKTLRDKGASAADIRRLIGLG